MYRAGAALDAGKVDRDAEYDRFGPWVVPITAEDPLPPLFLPHCTRSEEALFSVKIPRKIERRNAYPGMNLYDYVVSLYGQEIEVLERIENRVQRHIFPYADIQYVRVSEGLLKGSLFLQLSDQGFDLPYNTVSKEVMRHVACMIRQRYTNRAEPINNLKEPNHYLDKLSYYFAGLLERLRKDNPQIRVLAIQPQKNIGKQERTFLRRLLYGTVGKTLLESMHLSDGRELTIITRGRDYRYSWQSIYGSSMVTLPLDRIQGTSWNMDGRNASLTHLQIYLSGCKVHFVLSDGNPDIPAYNNFLLASSQR